MQKTKIREQEKQIEKYRIEVLELQVQAQQVRKTEEDEERRVRSMKQERCASQQNRRSSLLVPKLDLTKIKPYEDSRKQKDNKAKQMQTLQPNSNSKIQSYISQVKKPIEAHVAAKTLEHYQQMEQHLSQSLSLSPKIDVPKKQTTDFMRHSSDQASMYYQEKSKSYSQTIVHELHDPRLSSQPLHNLSTTIEVLPNSSMNSTFVGFENDLGDRPRKRSVPPVHIPLLDFSKLNQPRASVARKEVVQPQLVSKAANKDSVYKSLHKPYTTIEPRTKSALQMGNDGSRNSDTRKALGSMEIPVDLINQKNIAVDQTKYRIDLQDVQRMPKNTLSKDDGIP